MKLILVTVISRYLDETRAFLEESGVQGYTEFSNVKGAGRKGKRMDSRVWPGTSSMLLTVVDDEEGEQLIDKIKRYSSSLPEEDALRAFKIHVEESV